MLLNYKMFLEKNTYHSMNDLFNLVKQIKDFTYNNDIQTDLKLKDTESGYIIESVLYNLYCEIKKDKIVDKEGDEMLIDIVYHNLDTIFNSIQNDTISINIQQIDEAVEFDTLKNDLMEIVNKSAQLQNIQPDEFIKNWVDENTIPPIKKEKTTTLEGLIQDEDIFDFYLKHKEDIDNFLKRKAFFSRKPTVLGLYDYVIDGTNEAIFELLFDMT